MNNNITQLIADKQKRLEFHKSAIVVAKNEWDKIDKELVEVRERHSNAIMVWSEQYNAAKRLEAEIELLRTME